MRRSRSALVLLILLAPPVGAVVPTVQLSIPVLIEYITPGQPVLLDGQFSVTVPANATCQGPLPFTVGIASKPDFVRVDLQPANGTFTADEWAAGQNATRPLRIAIEVNRTAPAYDRIDIRVRATTGVCGDAEAALAIAQFGAEVGFLPKAVLRVVAKDASHWTLEATNEGNAATRLDWQLLQPSLGRVLAGARAHMPDPGNGTGPATVRFEVPSAGIDRSATAHLEAVLTYEGPHAVVDSPTGFERLVLNEPRSAGTGGVSLLLFALGAAGLVVGARRRRRLGE